MTDEITFLPEGSKSPNQIVIGGRFVHSRRPESEAKRQATELLKQNPTVVILLGAGLGFLIEELLSANVVIVWVEEIAEIRRAAIERLSPYLKNYRKTNNSQYKTHTGELKLMWFTQCPSLQQLKEKLGDNILRWQPFILRATAKPSYSSLLQAINQKQFKEIVNQNTLQRFDKLWLKNIYYNLKHYQRFKPLNQLLKNHTTKPVVIVSAGPSLNQSLPLLKEYRQQVVIVAVDTAIHVLNTFGIDADFLLSVDAQSANFLHLRNYQGKARLIIDITVSYLTMRHLHGFYYLFANPLPAANFFLKKIFNADLAELQFGGSVSTNAFDFTLQLKPASIYFCGLDLSFVNKQIHAKGSALEEASLSKTNRLLSPQLQNYRQITAIDRRYLKNKSGKLVPTNDKLLLFYNWYISQFSKLQNDSTTPKLYIVDGQGAYFQKVETISISNFEQQLKLVENQLQSIDSNTILDQPIFEFNTLLDSINDRLDSMLTLLNKPPSPDLALHLLHEDNQSKLPILKLLSAGMQNQLNQNFNNLTNNELAAFFQGLQANCLLHKKLIQRLL